MFDIECVEFENFRSYIGPHKVVFPTRPGLYCLTGCNKRNPRLGANDTGKTTLLEAIHWCLYSKTTRGAKARRVISWGKTSCSVTVGMKIGEGAYSITRTQSPNSLTCNDNIMAQADLQTLLRLGQQAFTYAVMLPQFGRSFFDLQPAEKLTLFSQILELEFWLDKSKEADTVAKEVADDIRFCEQRLFRVKGQIETTEADLKPLREQEATFREVQSETIRGLQKELDGLQVQVKELEAEKRQCCALLMQAEKKLNGVTDAVKAADVEQRRNATQQAVLADNQAKLTQAVADLDEIEATCPTCLQAVPKRHLEMERQVMKRKLDNNGAGLKLMLQQGKRLDEKLAKAQDDLRTLQQNQRDWNRELSKVAIKRESAVDRCLALRNSIKDETNRPNPYTKMITDKAAALTVLKQKRDALKRQIEAGQRDHAAASFWVGGFKRVRLFIMEETLRQLEIEVNNNLANLGMPDWHIELDVERENLAGGITRGFMVNVSSPDHKEPLAFEDIGGGVTQRLRLAGDLGLANLIMTRAGLQGQIEFYDEPSEHLSDEGLIDMAETLCQRAVDSGRRVFLIDHRNIDYGGFSGVYVAIKDKNGSRIVRDDVQGDH